MSDLVTTAARSGEPTGTGCLMSVLALASSVCLGLAGLMAAAYAWTH